MPRRAISSSGCGSTTINGKHTHGKDNKRKKRLKKYGKAMESAQKPRKPRGM
jgi:hypothetical protein